MLRKCILITILFLLSSSLTFSRTMVLEEPLNDPEAGKIEIDIVDLTAGYDMWTLQGYTEQNEFIRASEKINIRYGLMRTLEVSFGMEYLYWTTIIDKVEKQSQMGLGQMQAGVKFNLGPTLCSGVKVFLPAQKPELGLGGGLDGEVYAILNLDPLYFFGGYAYTTEFSLTIPATGEEIAFDPGDVLIGGGSIVIGKGSFKLVCDARMTQFTKNKVNGTNMADTDGITYDIFPGIIIDTGSLIFRIGAGIGLGDENFRGPGTVSPVFKYRQLSYDITAILGVTLKLK